MQKFVTSAALVAAAGLAAAGQIDQYALTRTFELPPSHNGVGDFDDGVNFDVLPDGRIILLNGGDVSVEDAVGAGTFSQIGTAQGFPVLFGASFLTVSPDGKLAAAGSNGGGFVTVFEIDNPSEATQFAVSDFDATWLGNSTIAISNSNGLDALDVTTGQVTNIVTNLGGASAGVTLDEQGRLYLGNGFDFLPGGSVTGSVKAFEKADLDAALAGGPAIDFELTGVEVVDLLSAESIGFDAFGNFFVGGADFFGGSGDLGYAALVDAETLQDRLNDPDGTSVIGPSAGPDVLRQFLSPLDTITNQQSPRWVYNEVTQELYLSYFEVQQVLVFQIPAPGAVAALGITGLIAARRRRV